jgi:hypothetical protein
VRAHPVRISRWNELRKIKNPFYSERRQPLNLAPSPGPDRPTSPGGRGEITHGMKSSAGDSSTANAANKSAARSISSSEMVSTALCI